MTKETNSCLACNCTQNDCTEYHEHTCGLPKIAQILTHSTGETIQRKSWEDKLDELCMIEKITETGEELS